MGEDPPNLFFLDPPRDKSHDVISLMMGRITKEKNKDEWVEPKRKERKRGMTSRALFGTDKTRILGCLTAGIGKILPNASRYHDSVHRARLTHCKNERSLISHTTGVRPRLCYRIV